MTEAPKDPRTARVVQLQVWWSLINLLLALVAIAATMWILLEERGLRREIGRISAAREQRCTQRIIVADAPPMVDPVAVAPPQDRPKSGYFGRSGTDILPALRLQFEALRADHPTGSPPETVRLASPAVLPPRTIHVVNLWATWCDPCLDEMPDFKALFARRADWAASVRFVPIQVKDPSSPVMAYANMAISMPPTPFKLADRSLGDPLVTALAADEERKLFHGNLPVTLVLDCNRRVRWAQFEQLSSVDFTELETYVDRLREELDDTSPGSWCSQEWPGNGRCEGMEDTPGHHSLEDCGELKRRPGEAAPPEAPPPPVVVCPDNMILTPDGKCKRKLRGNAPVTTRVTKPASCGNGKCDGDETRSTCCQDCPCTAPLVCKAAESGKQMCMVKGLKL